MSLKDTQYVFTCTSYCQSTYPSKMRFWPLVLVLSMSSVPCERRFSKLSIIKNDHRQCLKVETFEVLMRVSLLGVDFLCIDWEKVFSIREHTKVRRIFQVRFAA